jgi:hypothetical protein
MTRRSLALAPLVAIALAIATLGGCPSVGAGRALDEAEAALKDAAPAGLVTASERARFDWFQAQAYLAEAKTRAGHGDWQQAEQWAVRARKAAEAAQRRVLGDAP